MLLSGGIVWNASSVLRDALLVYCSAGRIVAQMIVPIALFFYSCCACSGSFLQGTYVVLQGKKKDYDIGVTAEDAGMMRPRQRGCLGNRCAGSWRHA